VTPSLQKGSMKIYCDTREQNCLPFEVGDGVSEVIHMKLPYGDYAAGWEDKDGNHVEFMPLFVERKGLGDLFGTLTSGMERFRREIARAKEDGVSLIIMVEGCFAEVKNGYEHSTVDGDTILKTLHTLWVKHDVQYVLCNDRRDMRDTILHFFSSIGRNFKPKGKSHESDSKSFNKEVGISEREREAMVVGLRDAVEQSRKEVDVE
jgi:ERCC4-type nuclease